MKKLSLNPEPTFKKAVPIPVPGHDPVPVVFVFKYMDKDEVKEWLKESAGLNNVDTVLSIAVGWEGIDEEFCRESLELFDKKWQRGSRAIVVTYLEELAGIRLKN